MSGVKRFLPLALLLLWLAGCAGAGVNDEQSPPIYNYSLRVVDIDGAPLAGAAVSYTLEEGDTAVKTATVKTDAGGMFRESLTSGKGGSRLRYRVTGDGYYAEAGELAFPFGNTYFERLTESAEIVMIRPADYLDRSFADLVSPFFRTRLLECVDTVVRKDSFSESDLKVRSISTVAFNNGEYLRFVFSCRKVYNYNFFNGRQLAWKLFETVVDPLLAPLAGSFTGEERISGCDVTVIGYTSCLCGKDAEIIPVEYRYLFPSETLRKYCNKDISPAELQNSMVLMMDGDVIVMEKTVQKEGHSSP